MKKIPRWSQRDIFGLARMRKDPKGEFILYADHVRVLGERVSARMAELATQFDALSEYERGLAEGIKVENARIREGVMDFYKVAPLAAEPILRVIENRSK